MPKLSDEQKQQYLSIHGVRCPYCGSDDIQANQSRSMKAKRLKE
jgi:Zn finger protein HypA/HybF involved in hydrogenase expression